MEDISVPLSKLSLRDILLTCPCKKPAAKRSPAPVKSTILRPSFIPHSTTSSPLMATAPFSPLVKTIILPRDLEKFIKLWYSYYGFGLDHNKIDWFFKKKKNKWNDFISFFLPLIHRKHYKRINKLLLKK